jgi:hypothetical protein
MATQSTVPSGFQFLRVYQLLVLANGPSTTTASSLGTTDLGTVDGITTFSTGVQETTSNDTSAIDLSNLRIQFEVNQNDLQIPNTMRVRVYNVSAGTQNKLLALNPNFQSTVQMPPGAIPAGSVAALVQAGAVTGGNPPQQQKQYIYNKIQLSAGYQNGPLGVLFTGDIITYSFGKERNVDSFLEFLAADGDNFYNQTVVSSSLSASGATPSQVVNQLVQAGGVTVSQQANDLLGGTGGALNARGKVIFGLGRLSMDKVARSLGVRWSIQNGALTLVPITGYLPGSIININSTTGMIGTPEATDQGVIVRCYINPLIRIGQAVQLLTSDIQQTLIVQGQTAGAAITTGQFIATVPSGSPTALFRVIVVEHRGDSRANDAYSELTCLAIDPSANINASVAAGT